VGIRLKGIRVNRVAATNPTTITSKVLGLNDASSKPPTAALGRGRFGFPLRRANSVGKKNLLDSYFLGQAVYRRLRTAPSL
jgi:hypothetical protein